MRTIWTMEDARSGFMPKELFNVDNAYQNYLAAIPSDDRRGVFHPSAIGMCARRNVMEYVSAPFDPHAINPELREVFDLGHQVHDLVQTRLEGMVEWLRKQGYDATFEREVGYDKNTDVLYNDFGVGGTCDGILTIGRDGWMQRGVVEIKSIATKSYDRLTGPKPEHLDQSHIYAYRFGLPIIWVWYFNKDSATRRVIPIRVDPLRINRLLERYVEWGDHARAGTLPDRQESAYECKTCMFKGECKPAVLNRPGKHHLPMVTPTSLRRIR